jgi:pyridoxal phosphate enzyme (YggS family)
MDPHRVPEFDIATNLARVQQRISSAGGDPDAVTIVAVTKGFGLDAVDAAVHAGLGDLGENYAQELLGKAAQRSPTHGPTGPIRWHFLGSVQRNKIPALAPVVNTWQAIDRFAVGEAIARRHPGARVLVQVNISGEASKHGCRLEDAPELVKGLRELNLAVAGLMAVGPAGPPEQARPGFHALARLGQQLGLGELSMGMTEDLEVAVQEGATMVRIGRALFGGRPGRPGR